MRNEQKILQRITNDLKKEKFVAIDTETETLYGDIIAVSMATKNVSACFVKDELSCIKSFLIDILSDKTIIKIFHNALYDFTILKQLGLTEIFPIEDTMIMARMLDSGRLASLSALAYAYCGKFKKSAKDLITEWKPKRNMSPSFSYVPENILKEYGANDARLTYDLYFKLKEELELNKKAKNFYYNVEIPLVYVLNEMNENGIAFDTTACLQLDEEVQKEIQELEEKILDYFPKKINLRSSQQLSEALFKKLNLNPVKRTAKGNFSVDEDSLKALQDQHPVIPLILKYKELTKLHTTYTSVLPTLVKNNRLHSFINSVSTASGRLASERPNLQNIPIRSDIGRKIRNCFIAEDNHVLIVADYSQIELRVLAHLANDTLMINVFKNHGDLHAETAKIFKHLPPDLARLNAKIVNFAMIYGASEFLLAKELQTSIEEAKKFKREYFKKYPQTAAYLDYIKEFAKKNGYVETISGRIRRIPQILSDDFKERGYGERIALNTPVQGSAADIIKAAMVKVWREIKKNNLKTKMVLQIHDELIFEVPLKEKDTVKKLLEKNLIDLKDLGIELSVPLEVSIGIGKSWGEAKK